ncbi:beta-1,3-N-acetylglucosaminyltransferase radical fringe-like [Amphiura filiformis]|uniref:beta-1,3-N-acetylglucosaminyltransferase radical fringe-like n=1 Tax=Amphiura filiformis TaxID=82378 RepID=UPI003B228555
MQRKAKKTCFKLIGKVLLLGIAACVILAFIGPCLSIRFNLDSKNKEDFGHLQAYKDTALLDQSDGRRQQKGNSAIEDVKRVPKLFKNASNLIVPPKQNKRLQAKIKNNPPVKFNSVKLLPHKDVNNKSNNSSGKLVPKQNQISHVTSSIISNATIWQRQTHLEDIFIGVKTGGVYHKTRLDLLLETWMSKAQNQTFIFTDEDDEEYEKKVIDGHLINTHCGKDHSRESLCCKTGLMFDVFMKQDKRWFCHLDDDNYLNVKNLVAYLQKYNPDKEEIYTGFTQLRGPIKTSDKAKPGETFKFYFGTSGAGFCISKALILKMAPHVCNGNFVKVCERIRWPDDMAVGFVVEVLTNNSLIIEPRFNSHIEALGNIRLDLLTSQITLSYKIDKTFTKTIHIPKGAFNTTVDPTRFRSLHCMLYPDSDGCPKV